MNKNGHSDKAAGETSAVPRNRILSNIPKATLERLRPNLKETRLVHHDALYRSDETVRRVYFIDAGMASLVQSMRDGRIVEVGIVGCDGVVGVNALFGIKSALLDTMVQMPGTGHSIAPKVLTAEATRCPHLATLLQGFVHLEMSMIAQTAACNRLHDLEQRCCRWLLIAHDNAVGDNFPLTHEFLAMMLGMRRPGVTIAMRGLQKAGYVRYTRGHVTITDRKGLERGSCECYATVRAHTDALFKTAARATRQ